MAKDRRKGYALTGVWLERINETLQPQAQAFVAKRIAGSAQGAEAVLRQARPFMDGVCVFARLEDVNALWRSLVDQAEAEARAEGCDMAKFDEWKAKVAAPAAEPTEVEAVIEPAAESEAA